MGAKEGKLMKLQECSHVQIERDERERCWFGERKGNGQQGKRPKGSKRWLSGLRNGEGKVVRYA